MREQVIIELSQRACPPTNALFLDGKKTDYWGRGNSGWKEEDTNKGVRWCFLFLPTSSKSWWAISAYCFPTAWGPPRRPQNKLQFPYGRCFFICSPNRCKATRACGGVCARGGYWWQNWPIKYRLSIITKWGGPSVAPPPTANYETGIYPYLVSIDRIWEYKWRHRVDFWIST